MKKTYIEPVINSPKANKAAEKIQAVARGNQAREEVNKKREALSSPPKPKKGEKENWLDDFDDVVKPAFGAGSHDKEIRKPKQKGEIFIRRCSKSRKVRHKSSRASI